MRRIFGIGLVAIYMCTFAEFHNLLKIPILFEHYSEHRQLDPTISFWSFIKLHYLDPIVVDDDYQRDQQLPFRDIACCIVSSAAVCESTQFFIELEKPAEIITEFHLFNEINTPQCIISDIFQPPRCA